jgi:hypothetical protein
MISLPHVVGGQREAAFLRVRDALYEAKAQALVISHEVVDIVHGDIALPGKSAVPTFPVLLNLVAGQDDALGGTKQVKMLLPFWQVPIIRKVLIEVFHRVAVVLAVNYELRVNARENFLAAVAVLHVRIPAPLRASYLSL